MKKHGTITGRITSNEPALQNLPPRSDKWAKFKQNGPPYPLDLHSVRAAEQKPELLAFDHGDLRGPVPIDIETRDSVNKVVDFIGRPVHNEFSYTGFEAYSLADYRGDEDRKPIERHIVVAATWPSAKGFDLDLEIESTCVYRTEEFRTHLMEVVKEFEAGGYEVILTGDDPDESALEFNIRLSEGHTAGDVQLLLEDLLERLCAAATLTECK